MRSKSKSTKVIDIAKIYFYMRSKSKSTTKEKMLNNI